jgi:hypothetical protein
MNFIVSLAHTDAQRQEGIALFRKIYKENFNLDFEAFDAHFPLHFVSDIFLIHDETGRLVGTASIVRPIEVLFPSEYFFETDIASYSEILPLHSAIEVGRLAKVTDKDVPQSKVTRAVMLAVAAYLKKHNLLGWVATVKPAYYRIIKATGLVTTVFEGSKDCNTEAQREVIKNYKGDEVVTFWAGSDDTVGAFEQFRSDDIKVLL